MYNEHKNIFNFEVFRILLYCRSVQHVACLWNYSSQ